MAKKIIVLDNVIQAKTLAKVLQQYDVTIVSSVPKLEEALGNAKASMVMCNLLQFGRELKSVRKEAQNTVSVYYAFAEVSRLSHIYALIGEFPIFQKCYSEKEFCSFIENSLKQSRNEEKWLLLVPQNP